jgi:anaerobic ribonucleoside-triphosphate reductase activating protein
MNVARILYPVEVLGPGKRIGIWVCGCKRNCLGCSNPELWEQRAEYEVSINLIVQLIERVARNHHIDGFTISGGEPMDQVSELNKLIKRLSRYSTDILVYTGYQIEELKEREDADTSEILNSIAVLIDGDYQEERNNNAVLRGSDNQRIHILNSAYSNEYNDYLNSNHNRIQNFVTSDGVVSVGIHRSDFLKDDK